MLFFISFLLLALSLLLAVPVVVLFGEVISAVFLRRQERSPDNEGLRRPSLAVVVPAHNEGEGLLPTILDIKAQLRVGDRLVVVADNCADNTASVAAEAGAEVTERNDSSRLGKGYALDWGVRYLSANPPAVVIVIDADCRLAAETLSRLATLCTVTHRPVQALDLMTAPDQSTVNFEVAAFAWRVKNWVRPLGLRNLNLPCQLMGTGMAFPWGIIRSAKLADGQIVEDLRLGLDFAALGHPPVFCPAARVTSEFPVSRTGAESQRQRWEHGHIQIIMTVLPRYFFAAVAKRNLGLLALCLDVAVPPLALLCLLVCGTLLISGLAVFLGASPASLIVAAMSLTVLAVAIVLSWLTHGRDILSSTGLMSLGPYILRKFGFYCRLLRRGFVTQWTRTERTQANPPPDVRRD
jgi:glycosyltransferase involved in cell wall biosynthesis